MRSICFLFLFSCAIFSSPAFAVRYYVDDVSSNGDGTSLRPFNRIQAALNAARPGDEVFIRSGRYSGSFVTRRHGSALERISITGVSPQTVFIDGRKLPRNAGLSIEHSNYDVSRITFVNHFRDGLRVVGHPADSNVEDFIRSVYVSRCRFISNGDPSVEAHGLFVKNVRDFSMTDSLARRNQTNGATFVNCVAGLVDTCRFIQNNGEFTSEGLALLNCKQMTVRRCLARLNGETGFDSNIFEGIPADSRNNEFILCRASENGGEGFSVNGTLVGEQISVVHRLIRCCADNNGDSGFVVYENSRNVSVVNCTAVANGNRGISNYAEARNILVLNSVFVDNRAPEGNLEDIGGDNTVYLADFNYWSNFPPPRNGNFDNVRGPNDVETIEGDDIFSNLLNYRVRNISELVNQGTFYPGLGFRRPGPDLGWLEAQ